MTVKLVFLGKLADLAGTSERDVAGPLDWFGLLGELDVLMSDTVKSDKVKLAVNGQVLAKKTALKAGGGDEIAFLPPVSGG
jgi:molybdopterin synthase sulfur carrier subunit